MTTTTKLALIVSSGNARTDQIFRGVFGQMSPTGQLEIAQELKGIHLLSLTTPEMLKASGIDMSRDVVEVEVADAHLPAVKATLLHALQNHWQQTYGLMGLAPGMAQITLQAEKNAVFTALENSIAAINLPLREVQVEAQFWNQNNAVVYSDNYEDEDEEDEGEIANVVISADTVGAFGARSNRTDWSVSAVPRDLQALPPEIETGDINMNLSSGRVVRTVSLYGDAPAAVLQAIASLPEPLQQLIVPDSDARLLDVEFHQYRRPGPVPAEQAPVFALELPAAIMAAAPVASEETQSVTDAPVAALADTPDESVTDDQDDDFSAPAPTN